MIGSNSDVRGAMLEHAQHGSEDASNRSEVETVLILRRRQRVVVPEQFVSAVDQVNFQSAPSPISDVSEVE